VPDNPEATIRKAQVIYRAALAPAEPSPQDRSVASEAKQMEVEARRELAEQRRQEAAEQTEEQPPASSPVGEDGTGTAAQSGGTDAVNPAAESGTSTGSGGAVTAGDAGQLLNLVAQQRVRCGSQHPTLLPHSVFG